MKSASSLLVSIALCGVLAVASTSPPVSWVEGFDISEYVDPAVNLTEQQASGASFVYIRCTTGYGTLTSIALVSHPLMRTQCTTIPASCPSGPSLSTPV